MYIGLLHLHNVLRWLILIVALAVVLKYFAGWIRGGRWSKSDSILGATFTGLIDLQFLTGLILYFFVSPITKTAFRDFGAAMQHAELRFYAVEHSLVMLIAVTLIHIGWARSKKATRDRLKFGRALLFFGIALILILAMIPWSRTI
jgi:hypothetical protein